MKAQNVKIGGEYFIESVNGVELIKVIHYVHGMGFWVKDPDGECFWADAEELEEF